MNNNHIEKFKQEFYRLGLTPPDNIVDDGAFHRFSTNDKARDSAGWYILHGDGIPAGCIGDWRTSFTHSWCNKAENTMTAAERQTHRERVDAMKRQRDAEQAQLQEAAATNACNRWEQAKPCADHPYLSRKGIQPYGVKREGENLLIPLRSADGTLHSLQTISPDGTKMFMGGGRTKGCYFAIGSAIDSITVCEGFATGASIHASTSQAIAVAFNAGNLEAVAVALRTTNPNIKITIAADDDHRTANNPGLTKAREAAAAVGGYLAIPEFFGHDRKEKDTDFNDLHQLAGEEAVRACFERAELVDKGVEQTDGTVTETDPWPELQPLIAHTEACPYPIDTLPDSVRCAVLEVAGFVKAPIPLIAQSALTALSLAIQVHIDVERAEKLTGPCSLFMLAIADSGERKSSCDGYFTKALRDYEAQEKEKAKPLTRAYQTALDAWEAQRSGVKSKITALAKEGQPNEVEIKKLDDLDRNKPKPPRVPRLIYADATPEALASCLATQWPSGGVLSNEAGVVLGGHAMGHESAMRNMALLNQLWDGRLSATDRKTTESLAAMVARLTMGLQVQEDTLRAFFANTKGLARGTGFFARFLISWPTSTQGTRKFTEAPANWPALAAFNNRLTAILNRQAPADDNGALTPTMLKLSPEAKQAWIYCHDAIEKELATGGDLYDLRDVGSKAADNVARLAALFHVFNGSIGAIDNNCVESAGTIVAWHLQEAKRFFGELSVPTEVSNQIRLETWLLDYCKQNHTNKVQTKIVQQKGPSSLRKKALIDSAVNELEELGRARIIKDGNHRFIQIRPELLVVPR
jgi:putative DNA primase/helicase